MYHGLLILDRSSVSELSTGCEAGCKADRPRRGLVCGSLCEVCAPAVPFGDAAELVTLDWTTCFCPRRLVTRLVHGCVVFLAGLTVDDPLCFVSGSFLRRPRRFAEGAENVLSLSSSSAV